MSHKKCSIGDHVRLKPPTPTHIGNRWVWSDGYVHGEVSKLNPYDNGGVSIIIMLEGWKVATWDTKSQGLQIYQFVLSAEETRSLEIVEAAAS